MRNRDMPANSNDAHPQDLSGPTTVQFLRQYKDGLTKREEAAMRNMAAMLTNPTYDEVGTDKMSKWAISMADALFDELDGEEEK